MVSLQVDLDFLHHTRGILRRSVFVIIITLVISMPQKFFSWQASWLILLRISPRGPTGFENFLSLFFLLWFSTYTFSRLAVAEMTPVYNISPSKQATQCHDVNVIWTSGLPSGIDINKTSIHSQACKSEKPVLEACVRFSIILGDISVSQL
jgi:hypothetical protein